MPSVVLTATTGAKAACGGRGPGGQSPTIASSGDLFLLSEWELINNKKPNCSGGALSGRLNRDVRKTDSSRLVRCFLNILFTVLMYSMVQPCR